MFFLCHDQSSKVEIAVLTENTSSLSLPAPTPHPRSKAFMILNTYDALNNKMYMKSAEAWKMERIVNKFLLWYEMYIIFQWTWWVWKQIGPFFLLFKFFNDPLVLKHTSTSISLSPWQFAILWLTFLLRPSNNQFVNKFYHLTRVTLLKRPIPTYFLTKIDVPEFLTHNSGFEVLNISFSPQR